jgi:hypothetical protein
MKNLVYIVIIIGFIAIVALGQREKWTANPEVQSIEPTETSEPAAMTSPDTNTTASSTTDALITVATPTAGQSVANPITVSGEARGYWFFEASAPVVVTNWDGLIIGEGYITAEGDWMTEGFVPFSGTIAYNLPADSYSASGTIIFQRANPSDLPQNDAAYEVPVQLRQ